MSNRFGEFLKENHLLTIACMWLVLYIGFVSFIRPNAWVELLFTVVISLSIVPLVFTFTNYLLVSFTEEETLPEVEAHDDPEVAVLYVTYNDVKEDVLERNNETLSNYGNLDKFILSDSDDESVIAKEKNAEGWKVFRNGKSRQGKSYILNKWLEINSQDYEYIVVLDSDSVMPSGSIDELVRKAEHEDNQDIGVFQSSIEIDDQQVHSRFSEVLSRGVEWGLNLTPVAMKRVYEVNNYWGHNALMRVRDVVEAGGFDEEYLSEDFALTSELNKIGSKTVLTDVVSFEAFPNTYADLRRRTQRWVCGTIETIELAEGDGLDRGAKLNILVPSMFYLTTPVLLAMVLLSPIVTYGVVGASSALMLPFAVMDGVFTFAVYSFLLFHEKSLGSTGWKDYLETVLFRTLVISSMSLEVTKSIIFRSSEWNPSLRESYSFVEALNSSRLEIFAGVSITMLIPALV